MHYFEESFRYYPSNFDNLIVLGFLYFRDEIYERAIKYFELACKVQPNAFIAEIQYAKCFLKLGNNREAFRALRGIHLKYPDNRETLTYLIAVCKELNLPYEEYYQKISRLEKEQMVSDQGVEYGQAPGYDQGGYGNPDYKGEKVDFSLYSTSHVSTTAPKQTKLNFAAPMDELLP